MAERPLAVAGVKLGEGQAKPLATGQELAFRCGPGHEEVAQLGTSRPLARL